MAFRAGKLETEAARARALRRLAVDCNPWRKDLSDSERSVTVLLGQRIPAGHERREVASMLGLLDDGTTKLTAYINL